MTEIGHFTGAMLWGFITGLGFAFIFCLFLMWYGFKLLKHAGINVFNRVDSKEIT